MKIAICIKQVPACDKVNMDPENHRLIRENAEMMVNPADLNALTAALELKEETGSSLDVFTMGTEGAKSALITALAMGADEAFLVTDRAFAGGDSLGTAKVLKAAIESKGKYDLIVCGSLASDGATGQVGPMLAQLFDVPSITEVKKIIKLNGQEQHLEVSKTWKGKALCLKMTLPGVVTIALGSNAPILPTLRNQMKAKKREIPVITNEELALNPGEIGLSGAKSLVTDTYLRENSGKRSIPIEGTVEEQAVQILKLLQKAGEQ